MIIIVIYIYIYVDIFCYHWFWFSNSWPKEFWVVFFSGCLFLCHPTCCPSMYWAGQTDSRMSGTAHLPIRGRFVDRRAEITACSQRSEGTLTATYLANREGCVHVLFIATNHGRMDPPYLEGDLKTSMIFRQIPNQSPYEMVHFITTQDQINKYK